MQIVVGQTKDTTLHYTILSVVSLVKLLSKITCTQTGDTRNENATDVAIRVSVMELSFLSRDANGSERLELSLLHRHQSVQVCLFVVPGDLFSLLGFQTFYIVISQFRFVCLFVFPGGSVQSTWFPDLLHRLQLPRCQGDI